MQVIRDVLDLSTEIASLQYALAFTADRLPQMTPDQAILIQRSCNKDTTPWSAYEKTRYEVFDGPRTIDICIGETDEMLTELLTREDRREWAVVTAENPGSHPISPALNAARNRALRRALDLEDYTYYRGQGVGTLDDGTTNEAWAPEQSFLVLGRAPRTLLDDRQDFHDSMCVLASAHGQRALVYGTLDQPAQLVDALTRAPP